MKINLMTWNTQLYEFGNNSFKDKNISAGLNNLEKQKEVISAHLEKENSLAVLQEIPYKCNLDWKEHELFTELKNYFPKERYDMIYNISSKYQQIKMTIVLAKKGLIEPDDNGINSTKEDYCNCFVSFNIKSTDLHVLAVHQSLSKGGYISDKLNKKTHYKPNIILGDFNAGDYSKDKGTNEFKRNRDDYKKLLKRGYKDICNGQITTTDSKTPIDHILLENSNEFLDSFSYNNVDVDKTVSLSNHYPIYCEIETKN